MKVLYITNSIGMGGASVALINILEYLIKKDVVPLVTCPAFGDFSKELKKRNIPFIIIENPLEIYPQIHSWKSYVKYPFSLLKMIIIRYLAFKKLCTCVEQFKPDIIHTNVGPIHIGYLAARKYNIPHIWHIREYQKEDFGMSPFPSMNMFQKRIHSQHNHCISITKSIFEHFRLNLTKDEVIYDGVIDKNDIRPINKNKAHYIMFAGRLEDAKGIKELLYAYNQYALKGGKLSLYVAGKGDDNYKKECLHILTKTTKDKVRFWGECEHSKIYELMYNAKALIVPSRNEGFGFITAEAMYNGTVVIGKDTGGTKEQMDNGKEMTKNEIAFRYREPQDLINLLFKIENLTIDNYLNIANNAQKVVCELYDKECQSIKISRFYTQVLCENNPKY